MAGITCWREKEPSKWGRGRQNTRRKSEGTQWQRHGMWGLQEGCAPVDVKVALFRWKTSGNTRMSSKTQVSLDSSFRK